MFLNEIAARFDFTKAEGFTDRESFIRGKFLPKANTKISIQWKFSRNLGGQHTIKFEFR